MADLGRLFLEGSDIGNRTKTEEEEFYAYANYDVGIISPAYIALINELFHDKIFTKIIIRMLLSELHFIQSLC